MTNLKLPTIAREVRLGFRKDSDLNQTLNQPSVNTRLLSWVCPRCHVLAVWHPDSNDSKRALVQGWQNRPHFAAKQWLSCRAGSMLMSPTSYLQADTTEESMLFCPQWRGLCGLAARHMSMLRSQNCRAARGEQQPVLDASLSLAEAEL